MKPLITQESPEEFLARRIAHAEKIRKAMTDCPPVSNAQGKRLQRFLDEAEKAVVAARKAVEG